MGKRQAGGGVEVTPAMRKAGAMVLCDLATGNMSEEYAQVVARDVFIRMASVGAQETGQTRMFQSEGV